MGFLNFEEMIFAAVVLDHAARYKFESLPSEILGRISSPWERAEPLQICSVSAISPRLGT
jgi:hypothetical protein